MGFATDAIHAGVKPDPTTGAIMTPVYLTSTYAYEGLGRSKGYDYARTINPTRSALEENLRVLERGVAAYAFASGMAAITAVMALLKSGDHVVVSGNVYGGTYRLFSSVLEGYGLSFSYVDTSRAQRVLGWQPRLSNKDALIETYDWYLANRGRVGAAGVTHRVPWNQQALGLLKKIS